MQNETEVMYIGNYFLVLICSQRNAKTQPKQEKFLVMTFPAKKLKSLTKKIKAWNTFL